MDNVKQQTVKRHSIDMNRCKKIWRVRWLKRILKKCFAKNSGCSPLNKNNHNTCFSNLSTNLFSGASVKFAFYMSRCHFNLNIPMENLFGKTTQQPSFTSLTLNMRFKLRLWYNENTQICDALFFFKINATLLNNLYVTVIMRNNNHKS